MGRYVIAVRREQRSAAPADWVERLGRIEGLEVQGSRNLNRVQVLASEEAIRTARHRMGDFLYIEPLLLHERLSLR